MFSIWRNERRVFFLSLSLALFNPFILPLFRLCSRSAKPISSESYSNEGGGIRDFFLPRDMKGIGRPARSISYGANFTDGFIPHSTKIAVDIDCYSNFSRVKRDSRGRSPRPRDLNLKSNLAVSNQGVIFGFLLPS